MPPLELGSEQIEIRTPQEVASYRKQALGVKSLKSQNRN